jgi:flagellar hook-associated protein 1 FlgK
MPISTFMGLQTALRGLVGEQRAIDTTGHNIANANTPGFSRQQAVMSATIPMEVPAFSQTNGTGAQLGTGLDIMQIQRIRNAFLDVQYRGQNPSLGDATQRADSLDQAQLTFGEPGANGLSAQLNKFWNDWGSVSNAPDSQAARQSLVDDAKSLASAFNTVDAQLALVQTQASQSFTAITGPQGDVQAWAGQIAQLNLAISHAQATGEQPNDLMDQRDLLVDKLSNLAKVGVANQPDGTITVTFGDAAAPLVAGGVANWPQPITTAAGGQLGALLDLSSATGPVAGYRTALDAVASTLASTVNAIHTATPFFSGTTAATIAVAVTPATVQTSATANPGANDVAVAIAGLRGGAVEQSYHALVAQIGDDVRGSQRNKTNAQSLVSAVDDQRQSTSGVSLDEEMTNLLRFQRGYQASARTLTTMDQMLDTLINRTGAVGL